MRILTKLKKKIVNACHFFFVKHRWKTATLLGLFLVAYLFCLPRPLFDAPLSIVLEDREGELMGARIAADGQWRFPARTEVPEKFAQALTTFEDKRFYSHWGIDPIGIFRAINQNAKAGAIVSGGSTISMQVIRMARGNHSRNLFNKILEAIMATRLELSYSKKEIIALHSSYAPFGGNVVGLDAAAWRYYGKRPALLSWGEAATLAVLPNSPALIHPGRNRQALLEKRNRLLDKLLAQGKLDTLSCELAKEEPLPDKPLPLPSLAPHLLDRATLNLPKREARIRTTLNRYLQKSCVNTLAYHQERLSANGIHNAAVLVLEVETGKVLAYVGNVMGAGEEHGEQVDVIRASRSTGSILKPFLYAMMLDEGAINPHTYVSDVPTHFGNYRPLNYHETYDGALPASRALVRSLNVPAVNMLQEYGLEKFHLGLQRIGMTTLHQSPHYYGLPLVLGGAEGSLWEITGAYASMARTLNHFYPNDGKYDNSDFHEPNFLFHKKNKKKKLQKTPPVLSAAAIYQTFETITKVERPTELGDWEIFESKGKIAWKTGTSFGFRDAWAVGVTPKYAVGVWVGNGDGEGRPGLVGILAAAPILFDVFEELPQGDWFDPPYDEMLLAQTCATSGFRASDHCPVLDSTWILQAAKNNDLCPFHKTIHLDSTRKYRVNTSCELPHNMRAVKWFELPPLEAHYYKNKNPSYKSTPDYKPNCRTNSSDTRAMQMIYPKYDAAIYLPIDYDGKRSKSVFRVAHRRQDAVIFWHLDNEYLGSTEDFHEMELAPAAGKHILTLVDEKGEQISQTFSIVEKD